ncbi:tRNA (guanosine(46)-N7)-methyltransferase TrmB [Campylobacter sp. FMV-PI01]|uniref:tRNA (guanine-N(7)-)-methyltransferase n=1 Tax=Campylobacter portucalensis TaxID=2608384 RepID=A0A6L5WKF7_9BACT|nr:tRNA (guanosine(46)-N7)-methyltransferase TrmB [Campylobacter portucalensis]MSN96495.1 tRNA (guanosine(46)-N7)-methyltransferase TrmB [Campylobacter portucalensis]
MPNFIASNIKKINFPSTRDGVSFLKIARGRKVDFILTSVKNETFFITIKPKNDKFVIKGEKLTRPAKIGLLQKSLEIFRDEFCSGIIKNAIKFNKNSLLENIGIIKNSDEALIYLKNAKKVAIEIGFGSGRHLLFRAKNNPDMLFIGVEIYKPAIEQVAKLALKQGISNLILLNCDARNFLSLIDSNLVDLLYIHFPVPWDDAPHRRVISDEILTEIQRVLKFDAKFELRSDSREFVDFSLSKILNLDGVEVLVFKDRDIEISSKYEDRWKRQNKNIYDVIFTNKIVSDKILKNDEFDFTPISPHSIRQNFRNQTYKFNDFFIHFEEFYEFSCDEVMIKLSFGSFDMSESCFIKFTKNRCEYFLTKPSKSEINFKAHKKIEEILNQWQMM